MFHVGSVGLAEPNEGRIARLIAPNNEVDFGAENKQMNCRNCIQIMNDP